MSWDSPSSTKYSVIFFWTKHLFACAMSTENHELGFELYEVNHVYFDQMDQKDYSS